MKAAKKFSRRKFLGAVCIAGIGGTGYARFVEPEWLGIGRHEIKLQKTANRQPLKILQMSDFHASPVVSQRFIEKAIRLGLEQKPDLIFLTGDFITHRFVQLESYAKVLSLLPKSAPTFACLGNHDGGFWASAHRGYDDTEFVEKLLEQAGVTLLRNTARSVQVRDWNLTLIGLGDSWANQMQPEAAFAQSPKDGGDITVVLSHNPDTKQALKPFGWDLMLCGHTHGGQVCLPFLKTLFAPVDDKRFIEGLHRWEKRWIHITRGVGNLHGVRFNCRPEVSLLTLV